MDPTFLKCTIPLLLGGGRQVVLIADVRDAMHTIAFSGVYLTRWFTTSGRIANRADLKDVYMIVRVIWGMTNF
jgi:hypothetical protein